MSQLINNEQRLTDIIFADRNKSYGAYVLRSSYGETVFKSLSLMILGVGSMASVAFYFANKGEPESDLGGQVIMHDSVYVIRFDKEEEKKEPMELKKEKSEPALKKEPAEAIKYVVKDSVETLSNPTLTTAIASTETSSVGTLTGDPASTSTHTSSGGSTMGTGKDDTKLLFEVDSEPVFEGGLSALYRFVSANLKYPPMASEYGKEGTVFVKFVVDENGKVGRLSLLNTVGYGMDDEAVRVVSIIPNFKSPAKAKGVPVKVFYQMPIRFRIR